MRSYTGLDICLKLLSGTTDAAALQTALASALYRGPWQELLKAVEFNALLNSPTALATIFGSALAFADVLEIAGAELAASDTVTEIISNTPAAILTIVSNTAYLDLWQTVPANKSRMQARVNASGSKICRVSQTAQGSYNLAIPAGGILALSEFIIGGGGTGATAGAGGSGGEAKTKMHTTSLPAGGTNLAYVVGAPAAVSSVGALLSADGGAAGTGPGTTSGTLYDSNPGAAIWQPNTAVVKGANGGAYTAGGDAGGNGISGSGGASAGAPGTGLGSGGAGGRTYPNGSIGSAASDPGCGGGGGGMSSASGGTPVAGGAGGAGRVDIYYIKAS